MQNDLMKYFPFEKPRVGQLELIEKIIKAFNNGKKHIILNAPTGWGKSVIAYTIIKYYLNGYILTSQKCLQEQYHRDLKVPYVLGRNNYQCSVNASLNCELGACKGLPAKYCNNCPYLKYRDNCFSALISNMNYSYFLSSNVNHSIINENNNIELMVPKREIIICDECHNLENELINLCSLKISESLLKFLSIPDKLPHKNAKEEKIFDTLFNKIEPSLKIALNGYKHQIIGAKTFKLTKEYNNIIIKYSVIKKILASIKEIKKQFEKNQKIIVFRDDDSIEFKLLYATNLFKLYMEPAANKFLHMSATILNKEQYCRSIGIDPIEAEYISTDAIFPKENRLIHFIPVGSMTYKNKAETFPKMVVKINELLEKYKKTKGIIHTTNYQIAEFIINTLSDTKNGQRLLMPRGNNRQKILDIFYQSNEPLVLISPSLTEGLDLKDDLSRFCIICKVPYASIADPWVKARMDNNAKWYLINTAQTLIQMTGRSIRSETDYCDTYILDSNFLDFAKRTISIFPDWWKDSVIQDLK